VVKCGIILQPGCGDLVVQDCLAYLFFSFSFLFFCNLGKFSPGTLFRMPNLRNVNATARNNFLITKLNAFRGSNGTGCCARGKQNHNSANKVWREGGLMRGL